MYFSFKPIPIMYILISGYLLTQTFGVLAFCPGLQHNVPTPQIVGICSRQVDICTARETNPGPIQTFDRSMRLRLWKKAKRMDKSFNALHDQFTPRITPSPLAECRSCMETLLPHSLPRGNVTDQEMRDSFLADFAVLGKAVGAFIRMRDGCTQNVGIRSAMTSAENTAKQLMCEIGLSLPSVGGTLPCDLVYPVLTSWCHANNCVEWVERNYLVMDKLIRTSQAMKSKYNHVASSHVIYSTN